MNPSENTRYPLQRFSFIWFPTEEKNQPLYLNRGILNNSSRKQRPAYMAIMILNYAKLLEDEKNSS